jgi:4-amino-4-deoxy-L-arabinose transferase-like glycosyltransferase
MKNRIYKILLWAVIGSAIVLRLAVFLQNRNLFIDEANLARNIFERSYAELLQALSYEQFAPPLFLWISKTSCLLFGYSELALRLFPLLTSIIGIILLFAILAHLLEKRYALYPLALLAGGYIFLHYATEFKQYSSDFMVSCLLIYAALRTEKKERNIGFVVFWIILGSLALWLSMPSVFILFSIGLFWLILSIKQQDHKSLMSILFIGAMWLLQFGLYYFMILQEQISSDYLQNYHADSFLYVPWKWGNILHDVKVLSGILTQAGGSSALAIITHLLLILVGSVYVLQKEKWRSVLFFSPLVLLILAGILHKYALVARLVLFIQPIIFVLLAYGVAVIFKSKNKVVSAVFVLIFIINIYNHQQFKYLKEAFLIQEIDLGFDYILSQNKSTEPYPLFVHHGAGPAFIFYTQMAESKTKYQNLVPNSVIMTWDSDYLKKADELPKDGKAWILLTNYFPWEKDKIVNRLGIENLSEEVVGPGCLLFLYEKP